MGRCIEMWYMKLRMQSMGSAIGYYNFNYYVWIWVGNHLHTEVENIVRNRIK